MDFTLNGAEVSADVRDGQHLLDVLREDCGITSVKDGCAPEGSCGACTVIVDGKAVVSCAQPASRFAGRSVTTQEGLCEADRERWADCFVAAGASQCGFCSPGIVMKAEALLAKTPEPTREQVAAGLAGNLCRCTGYVKIIDAIMLAAGARRGEPLPPIDNSGRVGSPTARYQGRELALGDKPYINDMTMPGMLHGAIRFADHPRAVVLGIDISRAAAHPGVLAVLTAADVPGERVQGEITRDWPQLVAVGETTRYVGDVIALVAASDRTAAREAAALVDVSYDVLEPVTSPAQAMSGGAPRLHSHAPGNVLSVSQVRRGDVDAALAGAEHVLTETFQTQFIEHAFLEPESSLAYPMAGGGVHFYSQGQGIWSDRRQVASLLGLPEHQVLATLVSSGGAFGAKEDLGVQGHAALLAMRTHRPVRLTLSRAESIRFHVKRHPLTLTYTVGCDADGMLLGVRARITGDTGAYASVGDKVLERAAGHACGVYKFPAVDIEARAVYTNNPPCGAMRGFGANQSNFAIEGMLDRLAERTGLDGWEIRWRNAVETGDVFGTGQRLGPGVGIKQTLLAVRDAYRSARYAGIGCAVKNTGVGNGLAEYGRVILRPEGDGTVTLFHSWTEMGQGVHTVLMQIACSELGLTPDQVRVVVETSRELGCGQTTASRATVLGGRAVIDAAGRLKARINGRRLADLAGQEFYGEVLVDWTTRPGTAAENPVTHFAYGWATQVVVLDDEGRIAKVVAAHDVGKVINPVLLAGQVEGAVHMGLGHSLSEEFVVENGIPVTTTLKSLNIIPPAGMPPVECVFVEEHQPEGPYGAKGIGEIGLVPTASAVAGALRAFDGRYRTTLPMKDSAAAAAAVPRLARRR
ncbi:MAG TPA: selenium-dependent xanthine dehydrogenase [Streptosporangiaceae bacterium]|nr:selenium-dependent xanthine dehydrogenase [Streptosporangiaceae bacterium]